MSIHTLQQYDQLNYKISPILTLKTVKAKAQLSHIQKEKKQPITFLSDSPVTLENGHSHQNSMNA